MRSDDGGAPGLAEHVELEVGQIGVVEDVGEDPCVPHQVEENVLVHEREAQILHVHRTCHRHYLISHLPSSDHSSMPCANMETTPFTSEVHGGGEENDGAYSLFQRPLHPGVGAAAGAVRRRGTDRGVCLRDRPGATTSVPTGSVTIWTVSTPP